MSFVACGDVLGDGTVHHSGRASTFEFGIARCGAGNFVPDLTDAVAILGSTPASVVLTIPSGLTGGGTRADIARASAAHGFPFAAIAEWDGLGGRAVKAGDVC